MYAMAAEDWKRSAKRAKNMHGIMHDARIARTMRASSK
jgi:hypothetical protein